VIDLTSYVDAKFCITPGRSRNRAQAGFCGPCSAQRGRGTPGTMSSAVMRGASAGGPVRAAGPPRRPR